MAGSAEPTAEVIRYVELAQGCDTLEAVAELTAKAVKELAPQELRYVYHRIEKTRDAALLDRFRRKGQLWSIVMRGELPNYQNIALSTHARIYRARGPAKRDKVLLIVFSAVGGGMLISTTRLLTRLPHGRFDVLWLRPELGRDYPLGVPGLGPDLATVCRNIANLLPQYGGATAVGASLGGFSALRAALLMDLPAGVSLSGRFNALVWIKGRRGMPAFDPLCACMRPSRAKLTAYYSSENDQDAADAHRLAAMHPTVQLVPIPTHEHSVLGHMLADGGFDTLFENLYRDARV